jgi:PAS domain S-box-containing protein
VYLLNEGLNIVHNSGEYDRLYEKWFGVYRPPAEIFAERYLVQVIMAALALFALALLWIFTLRREVTRKTGALADELRQKTMIEGQLAAGAERLVAIISSIQEGVIVADSDGAVSMINGAAALVLGRPAESVRGMNIEQVLPLHGSGDGPHPVRQALESGRAVVLPRAGVVRASGTVMQSFLSVAPVSDTTGVVQGVVAVFRDIAPLLQQEEQMQMNRKLESISLLAGGIAHDFNNIMTGIGGNISLALPQIAAGSEPAELLGEAASAVEQARALTRQLLTFARGGSPVRENVDTVSLIEETVSFNLRGSAVRREMVFEDSLWPVEADRGQISQAIQNLVLNAAQAITSRGAQYHGGQCCCRCGQPLAAARRQLCQYCNR